MLGKLNLKVFLPNRLRARVERESGGKNTVVYDVDGNPSIMVVVPCFNVEDLDPRFGSGPHPAFIVAGKVKSEILIGKYQASLERGLPVSLPNRDPAVRLTFDGALTHCRAKGPGWHLMTNAEWAAVALLCWKNGYLPRGNTNYGRSSESAEESGSFHDRFEPKVPHTDAWTLTGSGPASWNHDNTADGIADLCGNLFEWVGGLRLMEGEIQTIPHNNAAINTTDQSPISPAWHAILENGDLMPPGTPGSLKFDCVSPNTFDQAGAAFLNTEIVNRNDPNLCDDGYASCPFGQLSNKPGVVAPPILMQLAMYPIALGDAAIGGSIWLRNYGERLPLRGGNFYTQQASGVFTLDLNARRATRHPPAGFRLAYIGSR